MMKNQPSTTKCAVRSFRRRGTRSLAMAGTLFTLAACGESGGDRFMSIGTGGTGGIYYVLGGAFANQMNQRDSIRRYTAEVTGASVENVNRVRAGQLDLGMAMAVSAYEAFHGGEDYPEPVTNLRIVAPLYPNVTHLVVRRGLQAQSVADLRGRRVSVGSPGSGTEQAARHLLDAGGLTYEDVQVRYLSFSESAAALQDGAIDAAIISVGYPAAAVLEATTTGGARLLPIGPELIEVLRQRYPYYAEATIPVGVYRGVTEPVSTVAMMNWVVARDDLPGEVVDHFLGMLIENREALIQVHEMAGQIDLADLDRAPIPLHMAVENWRTRR
jgi:uncharacterized protein